MTRRPLAELSDWELEHNDQDLRGTYLQDAQGHNIGKIDQMIVNTDLGYVDALILDNGTEIPIEQIELQDHNQAILKSARATTATTTTSTTTHATTGQTKQQQGEVRLPVIEEELSVGKRQVQQGGVRITTRIREQPVQETVTLREENGQCRAATRQPPSLRARPGPRSARNVRGTGSGRRSRRQQASSRD